MVVDLLNEECEEICKHNSATDANFQLIVPSLKRKFAHSDKQIQDHKMKSVLVSDTNPHT